ncbi:MAG: helix-turn-helix transcriptional regulator [Alphaproteobacteria bacterium]|nr:helix-turn-helix transcriptional regulator [Alphaproteobacteria bacterium]MBV8549159.1 helix-turn-helix transcriptional regulator [Alphaproteobacteria bacterium]
MRSLYHPPVDQITVEGILHAFSDPIRIEIFANLAMAECAKNCSTFLTIHKQQLPKSTLSQHFRILREAGLIRSERKGVELVNVTRCAELKQRFGPMVQGIVEAYAAQQKAKKKK